MVTTKLRKFGLCPICGKNVKLRMVQEAGKWAYARTTDKRLIGTCCDAFTEEQWVGDGVDAEPKMGPKQLWKLACEAGHAAATKHQPTPMVVQAHANQLDDASPVVQEWVVDSGVCGFAWIKIRPARGKFVQWCKQQGIGRVDSYAGGFTIWIGDYGQSYERKMAFAEAAAKVLREVGGLKAYADGRLD